VVGSLGSIIPNVEFSQGKQAAAVGVAKKASGQVQAADKQRDWGQTQAARQFWENGDIQNLQ